MTSERFAHLTDSQLIKRQESARDFSYDDEAVALSKRLGARALTWKWSDDFFHPKVEVYDPAQGAGETES